MENMDQAPYLVDRGRWGYRMGDGQLYDSVLRDGVNDAFSDARRPQRRSTIRSKAKNTLSNNGTIRECG